MGCGATPFGLRLGGFAPNPPGHAMQALNFLADEAVRQFSNSQPLIDKGEITVPTS
jgi:hypothetical protein